MKSQSDRLSVRTTKKLLPGQPRTKKLLKQYGSDLVCVRYRYDSKRRLKLKTIELIVDKAPWRSDCHEIPPEKIITLRIQYGEIELGRLVKAAGGKWNGNKKVWELAYKEAVALGLTERILKTDE